MTIAIAPKPRILPDKPEPKENSGLLGTLWQREMQSAITDPEQLVRMLDLGGEWINGAKKAANLFPLRVPLSYLSRIKRGDPADPLLRQVLPITEEFDEVPGFIGDAVGDLASTKGNGLLHKYNGRVLLITTGACAINCRFCFRREFPYESQTAARHHWGPSLELIRNDTDIKEVILSGGDPLSLSDRKLSELSQLLDDIPHLQRLRIHSRQPIVLPERVDDQLLAWLSKGRLQRIFVTHVNHPTELDENVSTAIKALSGTGAVMLNQTVLLKGVNDSAETLISLSESLFKLNIIPYYLHLLDRVKGTAHFEVNEKEAAKFMLKMAKELPGYMVPKLVKEEMGKSNKTNVLW